MSARWTEDDLATFKRNSGRGLPERTLKEMTRIQGVQLDTDGNQVPTPADPQSGEKKRKSKKRRTKISDLGDGAKAAVKTAITKLAKKVPGKSKLGNTKTERDGIVFHSKLEADFYTELCFRKKAKEIDFFHMQVPIVLEGGVKLIVDFVTYTLYEQTEHEPAVWDVHWYDTKGFHTRESKNKIKQAQARYPGLKVELVKTVRKLVSR